MATWPASTACAAFAISSSGNLLHVARRFLVGRSHAVALVRGRVLVGPPHEGDVAHLDPAVRDALQLGRDALGHLLGHALDVPALGDPGARAARARSAPPPRGRRARRSPPARRSAPCGSSPTCRRARSDAKSRRDARRAAGPRAPRQIRPAATDGSFPVTVSGGSSGASAAGSSGGRESGALGGRRSSATRSAIRRTCLSGSCHQSVAHTRSRCQPRLRSTPWRVRSRSPAVGPVAYIGPSVSTPSRKRWGSVGVRDAEVDAVSRAPDARDDGEPGPLERAREPRLDPGGVTAAPGLDQGLVERRRAPLGVGQERLEVLHADGLRPGEVDVVRPKRGEDDDLLAGARDRHIETPLAPVAVQRTRSSSRCAPGHPGRSRRRTGSRRARRPGRSPGSSRTPAPRRSPR